MRTILRSIGFNGTFSADTLPSHLVVLGVVGGGSLPYTHTKSQVLYRVIGLNYMAQLVGNTMLFTPCASSCGNGLW